MHFTEHKTTHNSIYLTGFTGEQYTHTSTCRQSFQSLVWFHLPRTLHNGCVAFHWAPISWWADVIRSNSGWSTGTTGGIWSHLICRGSCRPLGCRPPATRPSPPPWAEASQGLAALVRPLSASPPPAPAWNRHTLLQQPTILVANLLQTPPNVRNISALGRKITRLCCFVDC